MESALDYWSARALLEWQAELGATEALGDAPVDRYALEQAAPKPKPGAAPPRPAKPKPVDPAMAAQKAARAAASLDALQAALAGFEHCELKKGARNLVFGDGTPGARVLIVAEAPGREEDLEGKPVAGRALDLLDRMLAAIGLSRAENVYLTSVLPWRPPQNRDLLPAEIAMLTPFLERHVELAAPQVVVLMGNLGCQAGLGKRGITRLRGQWGKAWGKPALPMLPPAELMAQPRLKRLAWGDLLELKARLGALT
ncbi:uracil-DNA glycosylase [Cribrihabitans pelagius]|uniref:uracil-DNA glycosylase n=1 Tax=Cribrihabitans pelagius TaxID=1765746 RepID=UPI003B5B54CB